jgi:hypothetical protein
MAFKEAERTRLYLRCALFGPSGSGKTMTALRMAKGIADKTGCRFAVIDTEARSASKYADRYRFIVDNLEKKTIDHYIASMDDAARHGYQVLVIDSLSHAWRELTEEVDRITQASNSKNSILSWGKVGPKQKRFIEAILNFPGHIIVTMRSKTEWVIGEGRNGKTAPQKLGLAPEQGEGIEYEFDLLMEMNQSHHALITKDRTGKFQDETIEKPGEEFGVALCDWLSGDQTKMPDASAPEETTSAKPQKPSAVTKPKSEKPAVWTQTAAASASPPAGNPFKERGNRLVQEIGQVFNAVSANGAAFFSEDEKADGRSIVASARLDESGIQELEEFKGFIADELAKRQTRKAA